MQHRKYFFGRVCRNLKRLLITFFIVEIEIIYVEFLEMFVKNRDAPVARHKTAVWIRRIFLRSADRKALFVVLFKHNFHIKACAVNSGTEHTAMLTVKSFYDKRIILVV